MAYPGCMRALPSATIICRVLVGLDRTGASGTLRLRGLGREGLLLLDAGHVIGANVDRRVATAPAHVLEGMYRMCGWEQVVLHFAQDGNGASWCRLEDPIRARELALQTMRRAVKAMDVSSVRAELRGGVYRLTRAGEQLLDGLTLRPEEKAVSFRLGRGVRAEDVATLPGCGLAGYRFLCSLKLLRAVAPRSGGSYPLLLRKRQQVRQQASAHVLLDLPEGAGGRDARRALRKLVKDLHPDLFGEETPPALRRASGEIVTALVDAEARIASNRSK